MYNNVVDGRQCELALQGVSCAEEGQPGSDSPGAEPRHDPSSALKIMPARGKRTKPKLFHKAPVRKAPLKSPLHPQR